MKCLHHNDADGLCAAYWVHRRYSTMKKEDFYTVNYGISNEMWFNNVEKDETIIIVDFSLEIDVMKELLNKTKNIIWIDHHQSAIAKYKDFDIDIKGLRYDGIAGCMLTWCYFNKMNDGRITFNPSMCFEAPWMTKYVHDHDVWKFEFGDETEHFKLGLDAVEDKSPLSPIWDELLEIDNVRKTISNGEIIEKYRDCIGAVRSKEFGFEVEILGYKGFALNNCFGGSEWFGDIINNYDFVCAFVYMGQTKQWEYSFYSAKDGVDCSKLAKSVKNNVSAGGHLKASGAVSKEFIF